MKDQAIYFVVKYKYFASTIRRSLITDL